MSGSVDERASGTGEAQPPHPPTHHLGPLFKEQGKEEEEKDGRRRDWRKGNLSS
jgi:hypothetical protein